MKTRIAFSVALFSGTILLFTIGAAFSAYAGNSPVVRERILVQLQQVQKFIENKEYQQSLTLLMALGEADLTQYERSQVFRSLAFHFYRLEDYKQAIAYYKKILALQDLPQFTRQESLYSLSQLYFSTAEYIAANKSLSQWFKNNNPGKNNPGAQAYELHGQIYYQLKKFPLAITALDTAVAKNQSANKLPKQNWLQMLQAMHYELGHLKETIKAVKQLINYYPKKVYWLQLAGLYAEQGNNAQQLLVLDAAYVQGLLDKEAELKTLAYLYIEKKAPYAATKLLQVGIKLGQIETTEKNLTLLASALRQAQETKQSIKVIARAADLSEQGDLYAELGQLYLLDEQFEAAISACKKALSKGELKKPSNTHMTLGIALLKISRYEEADTAFEQAKKDPSAVALAEQWQTHLSNNQKTESMLN